MSYLDELLDKYGSKITDFDVFKGFTPEGKWALMEHWRARFGNKKIREAWGMAPQHYYSVTNKTKKAAGAPTRGQSADDYAMPGQESPAPKNHKQQRRIINDDDVIEAEFTVKAEPEQPQLPAVVSPPAATAVTTPMINYDLTDEPSNLCERMAAIAALLKLEKGTLRVKIEVYK